MVKLVGVVLSVVKMQVRRVCGIAVALLSVVEIVSSVTKMRAGCREGATGPVVVSDM